MNAREYLHAKLDAIDTEVQQKAIHAIRVFEDIFGMEMAPMFPAAHLLEGYGFALTWDTPHTFLSLDIMPEELPEFYLVDKLHGNTGSYAWHEDTAVPEEICLVLNKLVDISKKEMAACKKPE